MQEKTFLLLKPCLYCRTFDDTADGYGRGEGFAVFVLTRDTLAVDTAALVRLSGSAVNQDGRSGGLTAPNGPSQTKLIRSALGTAGLEASKLSYTAVHGTGEGTMLSLPSLPLASDSSTRQILPEKRKLAK